MGMNETITAANTMKLVQQNRERELREQGLIGHNATAREVRAVEAQIRAAQPPPQGGALVLQLLLMFGGIGLFVWFCIAIIATIVS